MPESTIVPPAGTASSTQRLRDQTATVKEDVRELGRITKEVSREKLQEAKHVAGEYLDKGLDRAAQIEDSVVAYVREKPVKSILIAAGAGALLGFLLSRR